MRSGDAVSRDGEIGTAGAAGIRHLDLEPAGGISQGDPDGLSRAMQAVRFHRPRACFTDRQPYLVKQRLVDAAAPGHRGGDEPGGAHVRGQWREANLNRGHLGA